MDLIFKLATKHQVLFKVHGDVCLFNLEQGMLFVSVCELEARPILGIECYDAKSTSLLTDVDCVADFSASAGLEKSVFILESCKSAREFIKLHSSIERLFEFIINEI